MRLARTSWARMVALALVPVCGCATVLGLDDYGDGVASGGSAGAGASGAGGIGGAGGAAQGGQDALPEVEWYHVWGDALMDEAVGVAATNNGDVVVAGNFAGDIDVGNGTLNANNDTIDMFVAVLDSEGKTIVGERLGESADQRALGVASGPASQIALTGTFRGSISKDKVDIASSGKTSPFVLQLDGGGAGEWGWSFTPMTGMEMDQQGRSVAVLSDHTVVTGIDYAGTINMTTTASITANVVDSVIAAYTTNGVYAWRYEVRGSLQQRVLDLASAPNDHVMVLLETNSTSLNFDNVGATLTAGSQSIVLALNADGTTDAYDGFGDNSDDLLTAVAATSSSEFIVVGQFDTDLELGGSCPALSSSGSNDVVVAKFGSAGVACEWAVRFGDNFEQRATGVAVSTGGRVAVTGTMSGQISDGTVTLDARTQDLDAFVMLLDETDGSLKWGKVFGAADNQSGGGVAFFSDGSLMLAVNGSGGFDTGGVAIPGVGGSDVLVARLTPGTN